MQVTKKKVLFFILLILFFFCGIFLFLLENKKSPVSSPNLIPTPTVFQGEIKPTFFAPLTEDLIREKELETNYASDRKKLLEEKPWLLSLPLRSDNYFVSYDTEKNEFVIEIYKQVNKAKQNALEELKKIGVDTNKEKFIFMEPTNPEP